MLLIVLRCEHLSANFDLFTALLEFLEIDRLGLVGIDQSMLLTVQSAELSGPLLAHCPRVGIEGVGLLGLFLELGGQRGRVVEQLLDMVPDDRVELLDLGPGLGAAALAVPAEFQGHHT